MERRLFLGRKKSIKSDSGSFYVHLEIMTSTLWCNMSDLVERSNGIFLWRTVLG